MRTPRGRELTFTLAGTVMLLVTFYVHEVKREEAKDLADALDRAQGVVVLRADIQRLVDAAPTKGVINPHPFSEDVALSLSLDRSLADVQLITSNLDKEQQKLFVDRITTVRALLTAMDKLKAALLEAAVSLEKVNALGLSRPGLEEHQQQLEENFVKTSKEAIDLVSGLYKDALTAADKEAVQSKDDYQFFNKCSYVLYPLGFLLNLIGKLYGLGEVKAE